MLQIIGWLLCVYLVFKGVEILQIGLASTKENKAGMLLIGWGAVAASVVLAAVFIGLIDMQSGSIPGALR